MFSDSLRIPFFLVSGLSVLGCIILGGFFYASQVSKQNSIERQQFNEKLREAQEQESELEIERMKEEEKLIREAERQSNIDNCLNLALEDYHTNWESSCESLSLGEDCRLPSSIAERWDNYLKENREACYKRY